MENPPFAAPCKLPTKKKLTHWPSADSAIQRNPSNAYLLWPDMVQSSGGYSRLHEINSQTGSKPLAQPSAPTTMSEKQLGWNRHGLR